MGTDSLADYLSTMDEEGLARLLAARPDALIEPAPRDFAQLARRLSGPGSLAAALSAVNRDAMAVGQAIAVLDRDATVPAVARLLDAAEPAVLDALTVLQDLGLAWTSSDRLRLPEQLAEHWTVELGGGRPVARIAHTVPLDDLKVTAAALGVDVTGLRKPQLVARISAIMADPRTLVPLVAGLPKSARARLDELRQGDLGIVFGIARHRGRGTDPTDLLVAAGLVLQPNRRPEVPREVALAAWLAEDDLRLTGRPRIAPAGVEARAVRGAAQAAARDALRDLAALLDEARSTPIAALKKGGVGTRERARLAKRLAIPEDVLVLWLDIAYAAALLGEVDAGYAPTDAYPEWRAAEPSRQWAALATAWHALEHAPLSREVEGDRDLPPPLPLFSSAGRIRQVLLRVARADLSVRGTGAEIDWFFPVHGYGRDQCADKVAAVVREAELLGVVAGDRVSELGEHLLAATESKDAESENAAAELARLNAPVLPQATCAVILQSDLTATVTGQPSAAVASLLATAAVNETRGGAGVWRFTPASVRAALDAGWRAEELLAELAAISARAVPQPLEYLVTDAARRHGQVRVRGVRSCVVADEALTTEILNTRSLAKLGFARLAPTVLSSPYDVAQVLERLRAAGLSPVAEDAAGAVVVENRAEHRAAAPGPAPRRRLRRTPAELAGQLVGGSPPSTAPSETFTLLAKLNPRLDDTELALLAHAVDHHDDVVIEYRDKNGSRTVRQIRPEGVYGRWLESWCHLRGAEREFTIANIRSVAPAP